ncbi:MAG: N-acetylmuramoyl-L-alanine amidase [Clostridiales bacterium]|nr:N-acetylmuramoyl-L-alanine amidase [Clostridiales bacterium]
MKKLLVSLALAIAFIMICASLACAETMLEVTAESLNIRSGPGTAYAKIGGAALGEQHRVVQRQDGWCRIVLADVGAGWVSADHVRIFNDGRLPLYVHLEEGAVNIRAGASVSSEKIGSVALKHRYTVLGEDGDWYKIALGGGNAGYVAKWLVSAVFASDGRQYSQAFLQAAHYKQGMVKVSSAVNLREGADIGSESLAQLSDGVKVAILQRSGDWLRVVTEFGQEGWIFDDFVVFFDVSADSVQPQAVSLPQWQENGPAAQGKIKAERKALSYGIRLILSADKPIIWRMQQDASGYTLITDMSIEGLDVSYPDMTFLVGGAQQNRLSAVSGKHIYHSANASPDGKKLEIDFGFGPLLGKKIMLDPGHGTFNSYGLADPGAVGVTGLQEKDVVLDIALKLKTMLEEQGAKVYLTRTGDTALTVTDRAWLANSLGVDLFVSIHANSSTTRSVKGAMVYTQAPKYGSNHDAAARMSLARSVLSAFVGTTKQRDGGIFQINAAVLRETVMPAVLVETAFISNAEEEALLATDTFRQNAAKGLYHGISDWFLSLR